MYTICMPLVSNPTNFFCETHFVFQGNDILVGQGEVHALPEEKTLRRLLSSNVASDWFAEPEHNYSAMMLEDDAPLPAGHSLIPLRQYFWECKNKEITFKAARAHSLLKLRQSYRFCPTCGQVLTDDTEQTAKKCLACGTLLFPRIEPCIIVLVSRHDRGCEEILLARSKTVHHSGKVYSCIAGFMEQGESAEHCVMREVKEETNLTIKNIRYVGSQSWPFPDQLMLAFTAEYESGQIKIQESELEEASWFKRDSLPPIPNPGSVAYNLITGRFNGYS